MFTGGKKSSLIQLDRCFPVTPALFTAIATVFVRLSSSSEYTEPHPGALFPPGEPFLVRQVICCLSLLQAGLVFSCPPHKQGVSGGVAHKSAGVWSARALHRPERFYPLHLNCRTGCSSHVTGARPDHRNLSDCSLWLSGLLTFSPSSTT